MSVTQFVNVVSRLLLLCHNQSVQVPAGLFQVLQRVALERVAPYILDHLPAERCVVGVREAGNHAGQRVDALDAAVGGHENLYHANGFNEIKDYNDRFQCTTGQMGGLPDVNTENPDFQFYYMTYVNDLLACGARGFRYDTAKHIGLPSDPLDPKSKQNDFWDVTLGRKAVKGLRMSLPADSLFIYGEVLQDRNVKETEYAEYMKLTASSYGHVVRKALEKSAWHADNIGDWCHPANPAELVTWVESHDTYCNAHESAELSNDQIKAA